MHRIVIAMGSDDFSIALENQLNTAYSVIRCFDGLTATALLEAMTPDLLLIDLSLPIADGITVLQDARSNLPPVVLGTTTFDGAQLRQMLESVKLDRVFKIPCDVQTIVAAIDELTRLIPAARQKKRGREIQEILTQLGLKVGSLGYRQLEEAIALYADDPTLSFCKEIYPAVSHDNTYSSGKSAEHTMRNAVKDAWSRRDPEVWMRYFPNHSEKAPKNKTFIARIAQEIVK